MKNLILLFTFAFCLNISAQSIDTVLIEKGEYLSIYKTGDFYLIKTWRDSIYLSNLKYAKFNDCAIEIINYKCERIRLYAKKPSLKNNSFLADSIRSYPCHFLCGTVPHYLATIEKDSLCFNVYKDEYYYDEGNKIPKELIVSIPLNEAESVYFVNGESIIQFDSNYYYGDTKRIDPMTLIIKSELGFKVYNNNNLGYFEDFHLENNQLIITKNGLKGIYNQTKCMFKEIAPFHGSLAKFIDIENRSGYISTNGDLIYCP